MMRSILNPTTIVTCAPVPNVARRWSSCWRRMLRPSASGVSGFGWGRPRRVPRPAARITTLIGTWEVPSSTSRYVRPHRTRRRISRPASPTGRQRLALGVAGGALHPHHRTLVQLSQVARTGVGARAAEPRDDRVEDVLHARAARIEVHP